ncbi:MAG: heat-inducible transcription repressor HrcA [Clostridia bacterium]|nr:heat-inducible transcription repressor HrcA [Clostridia bacterium]
MELSERKEMILSAVIERFLTTGEPVGSKFLVGVLSVPVSSATIRNDMAYLSDMGYLDQPHTSAGRIPSDKGYRYYIERLLQNFSPSDADIFRILSFIDSSEGDTVGILSQICEALSAVTGLTAVAITPHTEHSVITGTQLIPLGKKSAMVVITTSVGVTKSRVTKLDCEIDYPLMELFYNVTAANFIGVSSSQFTKARLQCVASSLGERSLDMLPLIVSFFDACIEALGADVIVKGQSSLFGIPELSPYSLQITELLRSKSAAAVLMDTNKEQPIELKIGAENEFRCMERAAVIKAPYSVNGELAGSIGVIGPTKTDYSRVIPLVKYISEITGKYLAEATEN